ncbi:MAG: hypothetical protein GY851_32800, partial [bacterium]|nr:hypothetical protein [bacterium]
GDRLQAMRASSPQMYGIDRYERTAAMVDLGGGDFYVLDCFFVVGGKEHRKFFHSYFGDVTTEGLALKPADDFQHDMEMRNFRRHVYPELGWSVDWRMRNYHGYLPEGKEVHVRYTDLTSKVEAYLADGWIDVAGYGGVEEWIPRVMVRRSTEDEYLNSTFVSVIEPYERERTLKAIRRLPLESLNAGVLPDPFVGVCVERADGKKDVWLIVDGRGPAEMGEPEHDIYLRGQIAVATFGANGLERLALCNAEHARVGQISVMLGQGGCDIVELTFNEGQVSQV